MGKLFDSPLPIIIIIILALLLFGAPKLPGMARSIGQSLRIFKSEVKQMKDDPDTDSEADSGPVEGRVVNPRKNTHRSDHHDNGTAETTEPASERSS
ncbi:Sec-independent protein translocase subunit TatA [Arthrobacter sp. H14]|uniref:Sec-independent protein translocase subunit TatA n=1 Tax=Arthrobacter sp. H14 TaxID=1312959 RepID=UPI0004794ACC|nr:Sec-independent protein translocase subunit TatA [Arthrobacter sp. H14]